MNILGKNIPVEPSPVHVAPGGSRRITIKGEASVIAPVLKSLMIDIAFGMIEW